MASSGSGRAPRVLVTPQAVREAALTLFAERGYYGTALSEIAQNVGISTPGLYNHMTSKQALLSDVVLETTRQVWADFEAALAALPPEADVGTRLRAVAYVYALRHATHRREALIVNRDSAHVSEDVRAEIRLLRRRHERAVRSLIEEGVADGSLPEQPPTLVSFAILEMCVSIARWFRGEGEYAAHEVADQYSDYAVRLAGGGTVGRLD